MITEQRDNQKVSEAAAITFEAAKALGEEYGALMAVEHLSATDEARIDYILHLATLHPDVDFWVAHESVKRGTEMGLCNEAMLQSYEDQKAWLREYMGTRDFCLSDPDLPLSEFEGELRAQLEQSEYETLTQIFSAADTHS